MDSILVVDDDLVLREVVRGVLEQEGFQTLAAGDGLEALRLLQRQTPACVILDIRMPRFDGSALLRRIREESDVPVLMLTACTALSDKVRELGQGADDYLVKPFQSPELVARLKAVLRRTRGQEPKCSPLCHAGISLEPVTHVVTACGQPVHLTLIEFRILQALMEQPRRVCTRQGLLDRIYTYGEKDVLDRTVDVHVAKLRRKLRAAGADRIVTVRGIGYKLGEVGPGPVRGEGS